MAKQIRKNTGQEPGTTPGNISGLNMRVVAEKALASERTLATRLEELGMKFKANVDSDKNSGRPDYSEAVKTLWEIALADKKQEVACLDAVNVALAHVVSLEFEPKIGFYSKLISSPPPAEASSGREMQLVFFSFLFNAENNRGDVHPLAVMVALDCCNFLEEKIRPGGSDTLSIN